MQCPDSPTSIISNAAPISPGYLEHLARPPSTAHIRSTAQLHDYYRPAAPMTTDQALGHRRVTDRTRPTLGAAAGKAFAILHPAFQDICDHYPKDSILDGSAIQHYIGIVSPARTIRIRPSQTLNPTCTN